MNALIPVTVGNRKLIEMVPSPRKTTLSAFVFGWLFIRAKTVALLMVYCLSHSVVLRVFYNMV